MRSASSTRSSARSSGDRSTVSGPLWELWRLDGLRDGGVALLLKIHHACIDGLYAAEFASVIFDLDPDAPLERPDLVRDGVDDRGRVARALRRDRALGRDDTAARRARGGRRRSRRAGAHPASSSRASGSLGAAVRGASKSVQRHADRTPRVRVLLRCPLADVNTVREAFGVSLNDVVLATCSGALRRYLVARDALPDRTMVAQVPMAIRRERAPPHRSRDDAR